MRRMQAARLQGEVAITFDTVSFTTTSLVCAYSLSVYLLGSGSVCVPVSNHPYAWMSTCARACARYVPHTMYLARQVCPAFGEFFCDGDVEGYARCTNHIPIAGTNVCHPVCLLGGFLRGVCGGGRLECLSYSFRALLILSSMPPLNRTCPCLCTKEPSKIGARASNRRRCMIVHFLTVILLHQMNDMQLSTNPLGISF